MKKKLRVLIVDDSAVMRSILSKALTQDPNIEVIGFCHNGSQVAEAVMQHHPDLITLDIEMPKMDGTSVLRNESILRRTPVLIVSSLSKRGADITLECLTLGAFDFILKPAAGNKPEDFDRFVQELIEKAWLSQRTSSQARYPQPKPKPSEDRSNRKAPELIVVGASTGGPSALEQLLAQLPPEIPPTIVAVHMPFPFTQYFSQRLAHKYDHLKVIHLEGHAELMRNTVYVCHGQYNTKIRRKPDLSLHADLEAIAADQLHRPSIDLLFESASSACESKVIACVLTGMGKDGLLGSRLVRERDGVVLTQSEESCAIFGMPRAVISEGLSQGSFDPIQLANKIRQLVSGESK